MWTKEQFLQEVKFWVKFPKELNLKTYLTAWAPTVKPFDPKLAQMIIDRDNEYERSLTEIIEYIKVKIQ